MGSQILDYSPFVTPYFDFRPYKMAAQDKPSQVQVEAVSRSDFHGKIKEIQKYSTVNGDIGLQIFADRHVPAATIDPKAERRLVRKIDMYIIPFICITYLITYIDKATLSYGLCNCLIKQECMLNVLQLQFLV
jgi:hypothetical protein